MNPCDNTTLQSELKAYLDGQLPFLLRQRVRRHLERCAACREELSAMEQISNELHADGPKPLDSSLRDRILNAVTNAGAPAPAPEVLRAPTHRRRKPLLIWGGAATALVAWFTLYPLFQREAEMARNANSNSHQIGLGGMQYTQDYDEVYSTKRQPAASGTVAVSAPAAPRARTKQASPGVKSGNIGTRPVVPESLMEGRANLAMDDTGRTTLHRRMPQRRGSDLNGFPAQPKPEAARRQAGEAGNLAALADEEKVERQVHRTATITVQVDNVEAKSDQAAQYAQTAGGYVAGNELNTGDDNTKTASLTLKVPVAQFDTVLSQVARMGEVKAKNVTGEDLTEKISDQEQAEHVLREDIGATQEELNQRLTKSARQERLDTLRELRTRIAQTRARLKLLRKLGALSDITLELNERPRSVPAPKTGGFLSDMNDTLHGAVRSMMQAARLPILTFIWILAYSPLWLLLILGYRYAVRR